MYEWEYEGELMKERRLEGEGEICEESGMKKGNAVGMKYTRMCVLNSRENGNSKRVRDVDNRIGRYKRKEHY